MTSERPVPPPIRQACALQTIKKAVCTTYTPGELGEEGFKGAALA